MVDKLFLIFYQLKAVGVGAVLSDTPAHVILLTVGAVDRGEIQTP